MSSDKCTKLHLELSPKELMQAVMDGELHPREYALIYEFSYNWFADRTGDPSKNNFAPLYKTKCNVTKKEKSYGIIKLNISDKFDTTVVNKCRAELGIATMQHDAAKKAFAKKNYLKLFFGIFNNI